MKNKSKSWIASKLLPVALFLIIHSNTLWAQWTTGSTYIYATDTTKKMAIGVKTGSYDLSVYRSAASTAGIRSYTANANLNLDRGTATSNATVVYKTNNVTNWNTGMIGNNDFSIKNIVLNSVPFVITAADNVGIGKTAPIQKLDINGKMNISGGVIQSGGAAITATTDLGLYSRTSGNKIRIATNNGDIRFFTNDTSGVNASGNSAVMVINKSGNVGIGNTAPTVKMEVTGKIKTTDLQMTTGAAANKILRSDASGNASWVTASSVESDPKIGSLGNNKIPHWNGSTLVNGLLVDNGNKVGIGINSPSVLLHLKGGADQAQIMLDAGPLQSNSEPFIKMRTNTGLVLMSIHTDDPTNVFMGLNTGQYNITSGLNGMYNSFIGSEAGFANDNGYSNTAVGFQALYNTTNGFENSAVGSLALTHNVDGRGNSALGSNALGNTFNSNFNTASGGNAGITLSTGDFNSFFGYQTDVSQPNLINGSAFGAFALINSDNKVRIGDASIQIVESNAGSWTASDGRFKTNVREDVAGLEFINRLRPVVYNFDSKKYEEHVMQNLPEKTRQFYMTAKKESLEKATAIRQTGFIAQEVEAAARTCGYLFNGVHAPENPTDNYSLSYEKMVVPLVKSVQELSSSNDQKEKRLNSLESENAELKSRLDRLEQALSNCCSQYENNVAPSRESQPIPIDKAVLEQNNPNPFNAVSKIKYFIPSGFQNAHLIISDFKNTVLKSYAISSPGFGEISIPAHNLAVGSYSYTLMVDGVKAGAKIMEVFR